MVLNLEKGNKPLIHILEKIFDQEALIEQFLSWGKIVHISLGEENYYIDFSSQERLKNMISETLPAKNPNFKLKTTAPILLGILHKTIDPLDAYVQGQVIFEGCLIDAMEFAEMVQKSLGKKEE